MLYGKNIKMIQKFVTLPFINRIINCKFTIFAYEKKLFQEKRGF